MGSRDGAIVRVLVNVARVRFWTGGVILGLSLLLVRVLLCGFSFGVSSFPSSTKKQKQNKNQHLQIPFPFPNSMSKHVISDFYFFSAPKIVVLHVGENSLNASYFMVDVVLWSICFSMISDKLRRNEQRFTSDQSTRWEGVSIGHVDPGNSRIH